MTFIISLLSKNMIFVMLIIFIKQRYNISNIQII
jgi:hypothetical protein